jgi:hypothetical protein
MHRSFSTFIVREFSSVADASGDGSVSFQPGDKIQVEVMSFGPLGASVEVISNSHDPDSLLPEDVPPLARGIIYQKEIRYFREARNNVDVKRGEVLPAYVERVREDGKVDIVLRAFGGKAKAEEVSSAILAKLEETGGTLNVGDKSSPGDIAYEFPGVSKASFKRAVGTLYRLGKIEPGPHSITLSRTSSNQDKKKDT